jgi:hypothetical protein
MYISVMGIQIIDCVQRFTHGQDLKRPQLNARS